MDGRPEPEYEGALMIDGAPSPFVGFMELSRRAGRQWTPFITLYHGG